VAASLHEVPFSSSQSLLPGDHVAPMVVGLSQVNDVTAGLLAAAATRPALAALLVHLVDCAGKAQLHRCEDKNCR